MSVTETIEKCVKNLYVSDHLDPDSAANNPNPDVEKFQSTLNCKSTVESEKSW